MRPAPSLDGNFQIRILMRSRNTITVLNTPCILTTPDGLFGDLVTWCHDSKNVIPLSVDFTNAHIVALRTMDRKFYDSTSTVDWFVSDSQVLNWAISLSGGRQHCRVYGPEFMAHFFNQPDPNLRHYFLGASEGCLEKLKANLTALRPEVRIMGSHHGYFSSSDELSIIEDINHCRPDIVWVGLGTPKQQEWISRNQPRLNCKVLLAVGFAFDVNAGTKKDAPKWLGPLGLTWLYRLLDEPNRLWKRYLVFNSVFLLRLASQLLTGRPSATPPIPPASQHS